MNKKLLIVLGLILIMTLALSGCNSLPMYFSTYSVRGTVTNSSGDPIEGATISFSNGDTPVQSNSDGKFYKTGLGGTVVVSIHKNGYNFTPKEYTVDDEKNNLNFQSGEKEVTLAGTITGYDQSGVTISIQFDNGTDSTETDSEGYWSKTMIITGDVTVTPVKPTYEFEPSEQTLSGSDSNVDFEVITNN